MTAEELHEYWTRVGNEIAARTGDGELIAGDDTPFHRYKATQCGALFDAVRVEGLSILEVGCGPGGNLARMVDQAPERLVGCDIAPSMIRLARRNSGFRVPVVHVDGTRLPFADGAFDLVFTVTVLQHDDDRVFEAMLDEIARVSRGWVHLFEDTAPRRRDQPGYIRRTVREFECALQSRGFRLADERRLPVSVSERAVTAARRVLPKSREGETVARSVRWFERAALPVTKQLDRVVPSRHGLCRMSFLKQS